jgi:hypothetical protein
VDQPLPGRHRPTRAGGLTSPDPVTAPANGPPWPAAPSPQLRKITHRPQPRRAARPPCPDSPGETPRAQIRPENDLPQFVGGSRLSNQRVRRMRRELRERLGDALSIPQKHRDDLECLENERVFVTFKPGHAGWRDRLTDVDLRPLLRQALVAGCAAVETFCADRVMERYSPAVKQAPPPSRLLELSLTVDQYLTIQERYQKTGWDSDRWLSWKCGRGPVPHRRRSASCSPLWGSGASLHASISSARFPRVLPRSN